jgi:hypothetical protein
MTQERIELTQFEGIRKDWLYQEVKDSGNSEYATVNGGEFSDILFFIDRAEISEAELRALTMVPDLIAELKRCYKELDVYEEIKPDLLRLHWMPTQKGYSKALDLADIVHENEEEE